MHTLAVTVAFGVALAFINLLGVNSPVAGGAITLVMVALEKLVRESDSIPVDDYVNK